MDTETFTAPNIEWWNLSPLLALLVGAILLLVVGSLLPRWPRGLYATVTLVTAAVSGVFCVMNWRDIDAHGTAELVKGALILDHFGVFAGITIVGAIGLTALVVDDFLRRENYDGPEVYALLLTSAIGGLVMVSAQDLLVLFLGLETLSLSLYLLAASNRRRVESQESGLKYFILGGFSSAFFLYGIALIYGATGSTNIKGIATSLADSAFVLTSPAFLLVGIAMLLIGLAFKVSAVPFQAWTPDVYQGAPSPITGFMASAGKVAAFAAMLRVLVYSLDSRVDDWRPVIWVLAVLSLVGGSVLAVVQTNVKRMLAFSSVSHAGFILVGLEAAGHMDRGDSIASVMTYLAIYAVLVIGSFAVVTIVSGRGDSSTSLDNFAGLARRRPALALAFTVFLFAQAGMPATSGFIAKFGVIRAAVDSQSYAVAIIAMLSAVIGAYLYLRIMMTVWNSEPSSEDVIRVPAGAGVAITMCAVFTIAVGVYPGWLLNIAESVGHLGL